jgi:YgiT-type zinc finger domain-containing protein
MKCANRRCSGEYRARDLAYTVRYGGEVMVIDHVPVAVCTVCGDVRLAPETLVRIEELLRAETQPTRTVPLLEFA